MNITSNIREKIQKLESIAASGNFDATEALKAGVNAARGLMQSRIFNNGKDANGESLGRYIGRTSLTTSKKFTSTREDVFDSETKRLLKAKRRRLIKHSQFADALAYTPYEKERLSEGRQIAYKDLEFHGSLRRAIVTANNGTNKVVCIIDNPEEKKIAEYQEVQIANIRSNGFGKGSAGRVNIFGLSDNERDELKRVTNTALKEMYDRILNFK